MKLAPRGPVRFWKSKPRSWELTSRVNSLSWLYRRETRSGSFLEEQAEKLGVDIKGEFAQLALSSRNPIRLGERCTVFMARDVSSLLLKGAAAADLCAG